MSKDTIRLRHMYDSASKAVEFIQGRKAEDLQTDEMLGLSLIRLIEIIGEAANSISASFQQKYPQIPWEEMRGARNRLIHGYFDVDMGIVWNIVSKDLPLLVQQLEKILSEEE